MGGYRTEEVNEFLREVAVYAADLVHDRAELMGKMEVLADKLEEYRSDDDSLRAALIGAQKLGDSVVREAKSKAQAIIEEAEREAQGIVGEARRDIEIETVTLEKKRLEAAKFKTQLLNLYKQHIDYINALPYDESNLTPTAPKAPVQPIQPKAQPILDEVEEEEVPEGIAEIPLDLEEFDDAENGAFPNANAKRQSKYGILRFFGDGEDPVRDD